MKVDNQAIPFFTLDWMRKQMMLCDSYSRMEKLLDMSAWADHPESWLRLLGEEWSGCDNIASHADELFNTLLYTFDVGCGPIHQMMDEAELSAFEQLPDVLTVYRGCYEGNKWGFSWSTSRDVAEGFPFLNRYRHEGRPLLIKASISKQKVAALKLDRGEHEIVTFMKPKCLSISTAKDRTLGKTPPTA